MNTSDDYDFKVMVSELSLLDRVVVGGIVIQQWLDRIPHHQLRSLFGFLLGRVSLCSLDLIFGLTWDHSLWASVSHALRPKSSCRCVWHL